MQTKPLVKTQHFEGPLDLLLELIEKRKLLINDISLSEVTQEYIERISNHESLPVGETAEFVALAATLLLIKSRSLLPLLELSDDESRDIKELEYRLALYQLIKESARELGGIFAHTPLYEGALPEPEPLFIPDKTVTLLSLSAAAQTLIDGFPQLVNLPKVAVAKVISLDEMIDRLAARVSSAMRLSFKQFSGGQGRGDVIVGFLALLELVKQGIIHANQEREFGDIEIQSSSITTPVYE